MILSNIFFSKHQNKAEFKNLDDFEVLISYFPGLRSTAASLTSSVSATSLASTASKALVYKKLSDPDVWIIHGTKMTNAGPFLWNGLLKIQFFTDLIPFLLETVEACRCYIFWKTVVVPKNFKSQHCRTIFKLNLTCLSLFLRANS